MTHRSNDIEEWLQSIENFQRLAKMYAKSGTVAQSETMDMLAERTEEAMMQRLKMGGKEIVWL